MPTPYMCTCVRVNVSGACVHVFSYVTLNMSVLASFPQVSGSLCSHLAPGVRSHGCSARNIHGCTNNRWAMDSPVSAAELAREGRSGAPRGSRRDKQAGNVHGWGPVQGDS